MTIEICTLFYDILKQRESLVGNTGGNLNDRTARGGSEICSFNIREF